MMTPSYLWSQFQANCIVDLTRKAAGVYCNCLLIGFWPHLQWIVACLSLQMGQKGQKWAAAGSFHAKSERHQAVTHPNTNRASVRYIHTGIARRRSVFCRNTDVSRGTRTSTAPRSRPCSADTRWVRRCNDSCRPRCRASVSWSRNALDVLRNHVCTSRGHRHPCRSVALILACCRLVSSSSPGVKQRFSGLQLLDREPDKLGNDIRQTVKDTADRCCQKPRGSDRVAKWLTGEAVKIADERREATNTGNDQRRARKDRDMSIQEEWPEESEEGQRHEYTRRMTRGERGRTETWVYKKNDQRRARKDRDMSIQEEWPEESEEGQRHEYTRRMTRGERGRTETWVYKKNAGK